MKKSKTSYEERLRVPYEKLFTSSPSCLMLVNSEKEIVAINDVALKLLGRTRREVIGKVCHEFVCPAEQGKCPVLDLGQTVDSSERIALCKGEKKMPILKSVTRIRDNGNIYLLENFFDNTERKERELELAEKLKLIEQQRKAIEELSTPIIKIWEQVLVLPLIGTIDTRRSQKLTESLLTDIETTQSRVAILDITGVPAVDSAVANHLMKTVASAKLLGAECVITGIRPEVAQTIVHLGVDLSRVETLSNLAEGLKWAFRNLRLEITEKKTD